MILYMIYTIYVYIVIPFFLASRISPDFFPWTPFLPM